MNYEEKWRVLADLLTELRNKGEKAPANVMNDLRSAKTMMQILKADPSHIENIPKVETYLGNVESYLFFVAREKCGSEYVELWMRKLGEAGKGGKVEKKTEAIPRFVPGAPRSKRWMRIQISGHTPRKDVARLAREERLSHKMQKNGYMLVYGDDESIKAFVKKMTEKFGGTRKE